jgi:hypothetical protein
MVVIFRVITSKEVDIGGRRWKAQIQAPVG